MRGSRLKPWKMKPSLRLRRSASCVGIQLGDLGAVQHVRAAGRPVEAADQVHERRLAGAGRPHDRDELARFDLRARPRAAHGPRSSRDCSP